MLLGRSGRFPGRTRAARIVYFRDLDLAVNLRTFFDGNAGGDDVSANLAGSSDFHSITASYRALDLASDNDLAGIHVSRYVAMWSDGNAALAKMNYTLHFAVDVQVFRASNLALYP